MPSTGLLLPTGDDTIPGGITDFAAGGGPFWDDIDEDADSADDGNGVACNVDSSEVLWFAMTDMPSDFGQMTALTIKYRQELDAAKTNDTYEVKMELYDADKTTRMHNILGLTSFSSAGFVTITGNPGGVLAGSKAQWDNVLMRYQITWSQSKGPDGRHIRISAMHAVGTYDVAIAGNHPKLLLSGAGF